MRLNISLPEYVLADADRRAKELGISRSGYIAAALQFKAQYDDMMNTLPRFVDAVQKQQAIQSEEKKAIVQPEDKP